MILFTEHVSTAQRNIISNHLSAKYNLTITNDYYSGNDATYIYDVMGIGQESDGSHTLVGIGGLYFEENGGLANGVYLMAGHDNTINDASSTDDLPGGVDERWKRDWYLKKTDVPGNLDVKITFDLPEGIINGGFPQNILVVVPRLKQNIPFCIGQEQAVHIVKPLLPVWIMVNLIRSPLM